MSNTFESQPSAEQRGEDSYITNLAESYQRGGESLKVKKIRLLEDLGLPIPKTGIFRADQLDFLEEKIREIYTPNLERSMIIRFGCVPDQFSMPSVVIESDSNIGQAIIELVNDTNEKICGYRATDERIAEFLGENKNQLLLGSLKTFSDRTKSDKRASIEKTSEYTPTGYTGKRPVSFIINNKKVTVKYWVDILTEVCNFLYNSHQGNFEQKVGSIKGRKRVYFSKNKDELRVPMQIKNSGIYVESNLSANSIVKLSENSARLFGYDSELQIVVE